MRYHPRFSMYILKSFALWNGLVLLILSMTTLLFSLVELIRRSQTHAFIKFSQLFKIALLQLPSVLDQLSPLILLFSTIILLWTLQKRSEIIVMRSLGYSIWSIVFPMILGVFIYSVAYFFLLNSFVASTKNIHAHYQDKVFRKTENLSSVSKSGLWLRHKKQEDGYSIIHVNHINSPNIFGHSVIYDFNRFGQFIKRYDVKQIDIQDKKWTLKSPLLTESNDIQKPVDDFSWNINLTLKKIKQTFQSPASLSFWQLPKFIKLIEKTGLSGTEHLLYFYNLLMKPFLFVSMILIGAVSAFASVRKRNSFVFILFGILSGFSFHFLHQVFHALGEALKIPLVFSSLIPTCISLLIGLTLLLHLEEG